MPAIIGVCNRVYTVMGGRISNHLEGDEITEENLVKWITFHDIEKE
jgi:ABC-type sugar transport system ATPase subunit